MKHYRERLEQMISASGEFPRVVPGGQDRTFVGALVDFFEPQDERQLEDARRSRVTMFVRQNWNIDEESETIDRNINDYIRDILPVLDRDRALKDSTKEYFDSVLLAIRKNRTKKRKQVKEERIEHFEDLLLVVYEVGVNQRLFDDSLGIEKYKAELDDLSTKNESAAKILLRPKSLSLEHERRLLKQFRESDICTMPGEELAAFFQMFTGLRNEEVTAVLYGDIYKLHESGRRAIRIYKSSPGRGGNLRIEMKTRSAYRNLPLFGFLAKRLERRLEYIKSLYPDKDVMKFTITCKGIQYDKTIGSVNLTEYGRDFLRETAPNDEKTAITDMLSMLREEGLDIEEKSPTAYLFRRNFATHLHNLGVPQSTAEFLIGHVILESGTERNHFVSDEEMETIHDYFRFHPYNDAFPSEGYELMDSQNKGSSVAIEFSQNSMFRIIMNEPGEDLELSMSDSDRAKIKVSYAPVKTPYGTGVDLSGVVNQAYRLKEEEAITTDFENP